MLEAMEIQTPRGPKLIGPGHPTFLIGEMSGNHNLNFERALSLIDIAATAGVDAVKIQTYTADTLTIDCDNAFFQVKENNAWAGQSLYSLYQTAFTPWEWQPRLMEYANEKGLLLFSTPFDETAVDFLQNLEMPLYKVASFESTHLPLLRRIGKTQKPVMLSRGLTSEEDIALAIWTLKTNGCPQVAVLHCISSYPATVAQMNLRTIPLIIEKFGVLAGLSDHSLASEVSIAAVALGASIIEKHYTDQRINGGPDSHFSLEANELQEWVKAVRTTEVALGQPTFEVERAEKQNLVFKRSIFVTRPLKRGERLSAENIRIIRPGYGLPPKHFEEVLGKVAKEDIAIGTPLKWDLIE